MCCRSCNFLWKPFCPWICPCTLLILILNPHLKFKVSEVGITLGHSCSPEGLLEELDWNSILLLDRLLRHINCTSVPPSQPSFNVTHHWTIILTSSIYFIAFFWVCHNYLERGICWVRKLLLCPSKEITPHKLVTWINTAICDETTGERHVCFDWNLCFIDTHSMFCHCFGRMQMKQNRIFYRTKMDFRLS